MKTSTYTGLCLALVLLAASASAEAWPLSVVAVKAPAGNCIFSATRKVLAVDSVSGLTLAGLSEHAVMQSRTITGAPGTLGAGQTIYLYRVDLRQAIGSVECVAGMVVTFGPVTMLPYTNGALADVFVITTGGLGTVGLKSAEQNGDVITFEFSQLLCVGATPGTGMSSFFFGLASPTAPTLTTVSVFSVGSPPLVAVPAFVPTH